jgi:hypothetical protein
MPSVAEPPPPKDWLKILANDDLLDLNAVVFTLAILSPMTVMAVEFARKPDMPANNEPIIFYFLHYLRV